MFCLSQQRKKLLRDAHDASDVRVEDFNRVRSSDFVRRPVCPEDAGIVDQHIDAAFMRPDVLGRSRDGFIVRDVDRNKTRTKFGGSGLAALLIAGANDYSVAGLDET